MDSCKEEVRFGYRVRYVKRSFRGFDIEGKYVEIYMKLVGI